MSGLSRATINQLETGSLVDLGAAKLIVLLDPVGINLHAGTRKGHDHALESISQNASVSYRTLLDPIVLAAALVEGVLPRGVTPHVATLLNEAPLSLIVAAVAGYSYEEQHVAQALMEAFVPLGTRAAFTARRVDAVAVAICQKIGYFSDKRILANEPTRPIHPVCRPDSS